MHKNNHSSLQFFNKSQAEISVDVNAVASYYPGLIKVYVPFIPIHKTPSDWELNTATKIDMIRAERKTSTESLIERSIRRSQKHVVDYLSCNSFSLFGTITFAEDRHNVEHSKRKFMTWLKNQRDRNGIFGYLFVPEYHKDGAIHFHGVIKDYAGKLRRSRNAKTGKLLYGHKGNERFDLEEFRSGFTRIEPIRQSRDDHARVGNYIRKYITKDMVNIFGQKRYWASQGLKKPIREDNPQWYLETAADDVFTNEYGKIYTYKNLDSKILPRYVRELTSIDNL